MSKSLIWIGLTAAVGATVLVAALMIRVVPSVPAPAEALEASGSQPPAPPEPGVRAVLTAGDVTVERRLPAMAFALGEGQSLDARLPPGPFEATFDVTFHPGPVRRAALGGELTGGTLVIERKGKVLVEATAGDDERVVLSDLVYVPGRLVTFTYRFASKTPGAARLRALWQPEGSMVTLALPLSAGGLLADDALAGLALVQLLNCAACHGSENPRLQAELDISPAPILGEVGARARPQWIRTWLAGPGDLKPQAAMPALFADASALSDAERIEDLTHFLVSMGGPLDDAPGGPGADLPNRDLIDTGMVLYHRVGCFACHGPLEPIEKLPGHEAPGPPARRTYTPLGPLSTKTTPGQLAAFLKDPLAVRPSGRMPSQNLTALEADAIAAYLLARLAPEAPIEKGPPFVLDPDRVERGGALFARIGCANCHSLGPRQPTIASQLEAPSLEEVTAATAEGRLGCLAEPPPPGLPDYGLTTARRSALVAFLRSMPHRRSHDVPFDRLAVTVERLSCLACHEFHGDGGPEPALERYFATLGDYDLGDEGRLPPTLSHVGAHLNPQWLRIVLAESGAARPYMATRMPQFGETNVARLPDLFARAAGAGQRTKGPEFDAEEAEIGRQLVGSGGFTCIQCHSIAGRDATDLPGPDLAQMVERLRYGYFAGWVHDPKRLRPRTRMPTFFSGGRSGLTDKLGGDADRQIGAIWSYLSQGELLPLPEGLIDPGGYELVPDDEPIVFRTFMKGVGVRAVACGFPEGIHCAFDTQRCELRLVWTGRFLSAAGAWAARGGSETNPEQETVWAAPERPLLTIAGTPPEAARLQRSWRGYRLDEEGRPIFMYTLSEGETVIEVAEQPLPRRHGGEASLQRRFELKGPARGRLAVALAGHRLVESSSPWTSAGDEVIELRLDEKGEARLIMELVW